MRHGARARIQGRFGRRRLRGPGIRRLPGRRDDGNPARGRTGFGKVSAGSFPTSPERTRVARSSRWRLRCSPGSRKRSP
jgi:hypothetical protein